MATGTESLQERARLDEREFYADPWDVFAELRREAPVFWYEPAQFWVLSKHEDIRYATTHPELFSSEAGIMMGDNHDPESVMGLLEPDDQEQVKRGELSRGEVRRLVSATRLYNTEAEPVMTATDPPLHTRLRKAVIKAFTPRMVARLAPSIEKIADETLDAIEPGETLDFIQAFSEPIPVYVISDLLGVPRADRDEFRQWSDSASKLFDEKDPDAQAKQLADMEQMREYLTAAFESRRENPREDLMTALLNTETEGKKFSIPTLLMFASIFLNAGNETTRHLLSTTGVLLDRHRGQRDLLIETPELIPNAVEEMMRFSGPAWGMFRTATEDIDIRGETIKRDDFVCLLYPNGNRDEEVFEDPETLDVTRTFEAQHLAFGWGEHLCLGAPLARLEARIALEKLLERYPDYELVGEPTRLNSSVLNGWEEIPARFLA